MKIIRERINKRGNREIVVELTKDEDLFTVRDEQFYRLGGQVEDVVGAHVIQEMEMVQWCSVSQKWV